MPSEQPIELRLQLDAPDADAEELDALTQELLDELRDQPVESVKRVREPAAVPGAKGESITGVIAAALLPVVTKSVVEFIKAWLERKKFKKVRLNGVLNGHVIDFQGSPQDLDKLIRALVPPSEPVGKR